MLRLKLARVFNMGKMKEKLRIRFDEDARRYGYFSIMTTWSGCDSGFSGTRSEYLSGFQKRKKERRKTVVDKKVREQREKKKEFQKQVRWYSNVELNC